MTLNDRYTACLNWFEQNMPNPQSELHFSTPFQLLVAVMLSAQCTDKRVNLVTPALFNAYPTPEHMAKASTNDILQFIQSVSYPNSKALHLQQTAKRLTQAYNSQVPNNINDLLTLPGVGRKTANVICAILYNQPTMAVDTHIFRVAERIGLTTNSHSPLQTEQQLIKHIPPHLIPKAHHWLLLHGRYTCTARRPKCHICGIQPFCRHAN